MGEAGRADRRREKVIMVDAVIVDAVRTPGGKRNGQLKGWHPVDLAAETLKALEARNGLDPAMVEDVFTGCVMQVAEQSLAAAYEATAREVLAEEIRQDLQPVAAYVQAHGSFAELVREHLGGGDGPV